MYSNSPTTGDWERFIAEDLVAYMDSHYRTLANRMSRGLAGHSMGGYGALRIGMKRPDVFFEPLPHERVLPDGEPQSAAGGDGGGGSDQDARAGRGGGARPRVRSVGESRVGGGVVAESRRTRRSISISRSRTARCGPTSSPSGWPTRRSRCSSSTRPNLKKYYAIAIDIGTKDGLLASNKQLHEAMTRLQIPHGYEEYDGDHTNKVRERIERNVLPFFSKNLAAPANPTSPAPQP